MSNNEGLSFDDIVNTSSDISVDMGALTASALTKKAEQEELDQQIERFLASGGKIDVIEANLLADPPKRPVSNYGSQPI